MLGIRRIRTLTPEQEERFGDFVDKWTKIGLSVEPANKALAEEGIEQIYATLGLPPPKIIWCASPLSMMLAAASAKRSSKQNQIGKRLRRLICQLVGSKVLQEIRFSASPKVWRAVHLKLQRQVERRIGQRSWGAIDFEMQAPTRTRWSGWNGYVVRVKDNNWPAMRQQVQASLSAMISWQEGKSVMERNWPDAQLPPIRRMQGGLVSEAENYMWGQHAAGWLALCDYFKDVLGCDEETENLAGVWKIAQSAGWYLPYERICWISERPLAVSQDDRGLLHNADAPAVLWQDGSAVYSWHGVIVPEPVITAPEKLTVGTIERERDRDVRQVMIERYGQERYFKDSDAELLDDDKDQYGRPRRLWKQPLDLERFALIVQLTNSTPELDDTYRSYFLPVHPECRPLLGQDAALHDVFGDPQELTALSAVASMWGMTAEEYNPHVET